LLAAAARYDLPRDGRKLLFRAITNACINLQARNRESVSLDDLGQPATGSSWELEDKSASTPIDLVLSQELRTAIDDGLQTLSIRQRSVLELSSLGYRPAEIAEMLETPPEHVRVLLFRARQAMAAYLNARSLGGVPL
jgi:RNA polymerase sigma-70 factor (ECF subfamily)